MARGARSDAGRRCWPALIAECRVPGRRHISHPSSLLPPASGSAIAEETARPRFGIPEVRVLTTPLSGLPREPTPHRAPRTVASRGLQGPLPLLAPTGPGRPGEPRKPSTPRALPGPRWRYRRPRRNNAVRPGSSSETTPNLSPPTARQRASSTPSSQLLGPAGSELGVHPSALGTAPGAGAAPPAASAPGVQGWDEAGWG